MKKQLRNVVTGVACVLGVGLGATACTEQPTSPVVPIVFGSSTFDYHPIRATEPPPPQPKRTPPS